MIVTPESPRDHLDVAVFRSPLVRVGRWRCPAAHPQFVDSGPASDALFVFPRESVWIEHDGHQPFVADTNTVTYYNKGQCYRRRVLSPHGDRCEWFAVAPPIITEMLAAQEPAAIDRPGVPFPFLRGPSDADSYLRQRIVFHHVSSERVPDRLFVEETVLSILGKVTTLAYAHRGVTTRRRRQRHDADVVESARDAIARTFKGNVSLDDIAGEVGSSVFHLARAFRARTGFSMHAYRTQLRLRAALEQLRQPGRDLVDIALDLGFSSHSHFTETFHRHYGQTPSAVRESL